MTPNQPMRRRARATRRLAPVALGCAVFAGAAFAGPAAGVEKLDPHQFDVQIDFEPTVVDEQQSCSPAAEAFMICSHETVLRERGLLVTGTVRELAEGESPAPRRGGPDAESPGGGHDPEGDGAGDAARRGGGPIVPRGGGASGTMTMTMDMDATHSMQLQTPTGGGSPTLLSIRGDGGQAATWHMEFPGGSSLTGTMVAAMRVRKAREPNTFTMTMDNKVEVVAGTGRFEGVAGGGTFTDVETQQIPSFEGDPGGPGGPGDGPGGPPEGVDSSTPEGGHVGPAAKGGKKGGMRLKLRRGGQGVSIVVARRDLLTGSSVPLAVAAKPGTSVRAFAKRGRTRVPLGTAVADKRGRATFKGALRSKLTKTGAWQIHARAEAGERLLRDKVTVIATRL